MIYFVLLVVLSISGYFIPKRNIIAYSSIILLVFLTFNAININDFSDYEYIYNNNNLIGAERTSSGWAYLSNIGLKFGLTYQQFKCVIAIICFVLIMITIHYFLRKNYNLIWSLYLIYPALMDIIQIRFFLAISIMIFSMIFLSQRNIKSFIIFTLLFISAVTIHTSVAFYIVLFFIPLLNKYKRIVVFLIVSITAILIPLRSMVTALLNRYINDKERLYLQMPISLFRVLLFTVIIIAFVLLSYCVTESIRPEIKISNKERNLLVLTNNINLCMLLLIPILPIAFNFIRIQRISWIFTYMSLFLLQKYNIKLKIGKLLVSAKLTGLFLALFGFFVMMLQFEPLAFWSYPFFR